MRLMSALLPALFVLLLPSLPVSAQTLKVSHSPRELGTAVLRDLSTSAPWPTVRRLSTGSLSGWRGHCWLREAISPY